MSDDSVDTIRQASLDIRAAMPEENVARFLKDRSGADRVVIHEMKAPEATGVSSGGLFITASLGNDGPQKLFLKYDTQSAVRPFHIYDLAGQFAVQKVLFDSGLPVPEPLYLDADGVLLGRPGFVMKLVSGRPGSSKAWVEGALAEAAPEQRTSMLHDAVKAMVAIHAIDIDTPELAFLNTLAKGANSIEREINWTLDLGAYHDFSDPRIDAAAKALLAHQPTGYRDVLNHGDNKFDNYLFDAGRVAAIIDFEMVNIAPPEMDLAYLLFTTRYLTPADHPNPGWFPDEDALIALYQSAGGGGIGNFDYFQKVIAFKFSVMILGYVARLGVLAQAPAMFAQYWDALENIASELER
jgi:aminoglycoside phosphotransferase (APT) family kinase protein